MKKLFDEWKWWGVGLLVILIFTFGIRFYNLTIIPVFADEAIYIRWAQVMKAESTLRFLPLSDGKQPLYMWMVIPFLKFISDPLVAGRMVSIMTGVGTTLGIFVTSYLLFGSKKVSLISSFFYALSPFGLFFDRMALADSMLSFFGVWIFIFGYLTNKYKRLDLAMITGFFLGFGLLTKSPTLYFSLLLPVFIISNKNIKDAVKYIVLLIPIYIIGYGMLNILRLGPNFHMLALRNADYVYPISHILTSPLDPFKPYLDRSREFFWMMGPGVLLIGWLLSYFVNFKNKTKEIFVLSAWFLCPIIASSEFSKTMTARYIFFGLPFLIILAGSIYLAKNKWLVIGCYALLAIFLFQSLKFDFLLLTNPEKANLPRSERSGYMEEWTAGYGIKEAANYLKDLKTKTNEKILVGTEGHFGTLPDGLQMYLNDTPEITVIGVGLDFTSVPESLVNSKKAGNRVYFIVNKSRLSIPYQNLNLKLIASYKKPDRGDRYTKEYVNFGPYDELYLFEL